MADKPTILLTGATGYIGRRLLMELLKDSSVCLKILARHPETLATSIHEHTQVIKGSTFDEHALSQAMENVETAYYLVHSLGRSNYAQIDRDSAQRFRDAAIKAGVKKIIYLGGLGVESEGTSKHLMSRIETGKVLSEFPDKIDTIWIRAGVIIGSGSTSFEIIRHLIQKLPIMTTPIWVSTRAQPIGVDDVIAYLNASRQSGLTGTHVVDIGSEILSYGEMMVSCAEEMGLKRYIIPLPFLTIGLSSYWLNLFTPVPFKVARSLIEGLSSEVVKQNDHAQSLFPNIHPTSYKQAVQKALQEAEDNQVISRWSDKGGGVWEINHTDSLANAVFYDRHTLPIEGLEATSVYQSVCSIGGKNGWFKYDWLWVIRGFIDQMFGGVGLKRGRRSDSHLRVGDSLDFWKVVDIVPNKRVLLYAQMLVPGKAWLEFVIDEGKLVQTAYFIPKGVFGRLYWYVLIPIHALVFKNMIQSILKQASPTNT